MPRYRILVVDDEEDVRSIICATLRPHYEVVEAHDGLDALEKLDRTEPDFVLMDVMMPLMDGFQACESIRKHPRFGELPVMFLSALGTKDDIRKGYTKGANLYLTKPFEPARLLRNIEVFFETTPPPLRSKKFTVEQLRQLDRAPAGPRPTIHEAETVHDLTPMPEDVAQELAPPPPPPLTPPSAPSVSTPAEEELAPPPVAEPEPSRPAAPIGLMPRVIIVDDDEEILHLMTMILENDYEVVFATDGLQAIERIVRYQPDLIIVDIMLPKMSGFQLCQSLRANKAFSQTPILVCSAKCGARDIAYARRVGANEFLPKPFQSDQLLDKLESLKRTSGFVVRPKVLAYPYVMAEISPNKPATDAFEMESEVRRGEGGAEAQPDTDKALKRFLRKEGSKDAFGREPEGEGKKGKKKKRFLFGFGGRE